MGWQATAVGRRFLPAAALVSAATLFTSHGFVSRKASPEQARAGSGTEPGDREGESPTLPGSGFKTREPAATAAGTGLDIGLAPRGHSLRPSPGDTEVPTVGRPKLILFPDMDMEPPAAAVHVQRPPQSSGTAGPKGPWGHTGGRWRGGNMVTQEPATGKAGWRLAGGCHWGSQMEVGGTDGQRWAPGQIAEL